MKRKLIVLTLLLGCGCASQQVPKSKLDFDFQKGTASLSLPKNGLFENVKFEVRPDKTVSFSADKISVIMDPKVIESSGDATEKVILATGKVISDAKEQAEKAGKASVGIPSK